MTLLKRKTLIIVICLFLMVSFAATVGANFENERIVVLDFLALDEQGNYIDTLGLKPSELTNLSRIMSQGIGARLVQYGQFDVQDSISLSAKIAELGFEPDTSALERAQTIIEKDLADQVITGSITMLQTTTVVGVQRFQKVDGQIALVGSFMSTAPKMTDAPTLVDNLVAGLFPSDVQVIERSIDQVFAVPGQIRLNLGQSKQITVYALDSLGRPVANPEFLYFSSDESKVEVDEQGRVTGVQPGTSTITVRAISRTSRSGTPATMTVTVLPPSFGVRIGSLLTQRADVDGYPLRLGMRITPIVEQAGQKSQQSASPTVTPPDSTPSNPLMVIASYFGSMLTNGLMTIDFDVDPTREILLAFSGVQRSSSGYIGTGVGYVSPMDDFDAHKGFVLRMTVGTQYKVGNRLSIPLEAVMDAIFPTSTSFQPTFRVGINLGLDLFP